MEGKRRKLEATRNPNSIKKNQNRNFDNIPYLPYNLVEEILQKLPVKALIRFKSVSKQWRSTIRSRDFAERHLNHQKSRDPKILALDFSGNDRGSVTSLLTEEEEEIFYGSYDDTPGVFLFCDGLVCVYGPTQIDVFNPATREFRNLPPGREHQPLSDLNWNANAPFSATLNTPSSQCPSIGFGRDSIRRTYKVVRLYNPGSARHAQTQCEVFALNTCNWRYVSDVPYITFPDQRSVYVNGSLHWLTDQLWQPNVCEKIIAFDLHTEKFRVVLHPTFCSECFNPIQMLSLRNRLCVSETRESGSRLDIWSMDPHERWKKMYSINLPNILDSLENRLFTPLAVCKKGRIVIGDNNATLLTYCPESEIFSMNYGRIWVVASYFESMTWTW